MSMLVPLYSEVSFSKPLEELVESPIVQRLRHVRLSNIDSLSMPGIAHISRFEHVVGTAHLSTHVSVGSGALDATILQSAALLHDASITPYGHLVEEALGYIKGFDHEKRLGQALAQSTSQDLGGEDFQMLGKRAGLRDWSLRNFGPTGRDVLVRIMEGMRGEGPWGKFISGSLDLDNLDNVPRIAFHMGLQFDYQLPLRVARRITGIAPDGEPIFDSDSLPLLEAWLDLRKDVYTRLMLSASDFAGKVMMIFATVRTMEEGDFAAEDWKLMDFQLLHKLSVSPHPDVAETVTRWLLGELWSLSDLQWFQGKAPPYRKVYDFSHMLSEALGRRMFAYRIKEKRFRQLAVHTRNSTQVIGEERPQWLLGVGSPRRRGFSKRENRQITEYARRFFDTQSSIDERPGTLPLF